MRRGCLALAALALLAGCGKSDDAPAENTAVPERNVTDLARPPAELGENAAPAEEPAEETPPVVTSAIPAAYQGRWGATASRCGDGEEMALTITPQVLRFYESEGRVKRVPPAGPRRIAVTGAFTGEGDSWENVQTLALSPEGDTLTISARGTASRRVRCS